MTRREWYGINKRNLDDAWRKKGKGEAPDDFMPPTPAKKRRRQPGARKKPPVQDKEPTPEKPEPKPQFDLPSQPPPAPKPETPLRDDQEPNVVEVARMKRQNDIIERATKEFDERIKKDLEEALGRPLTQQEEERMFDAFNNEMNKDWKPLDAYDNIRAVLDAREGEAKQEVARGQIGQLEEDWNNAEGDIRQILRDEIRAEQNDRGKLGALAEVAALEGRKQRFQEAKKLWNDALKEQGGQEEGRTAKQRREQDGGGEVNAEEEKAIQDAKFDADGAVDAIETLLAGRKLDTNEKAQLKRKYREVQGAQETAQKGIRKNVDDFLKNQNFTDAETYLSDVENSAIKMIEDMKKQQERLSAIAQNENMADRVRQDALRGIAENAAYLDAARINIRYVNEQKKNIAAAKAVARAENPALDFRDVPFKAYAADATEPNRFMINANDRADAREQLRLMVGEAARRETKKWEEGQRKKPKMMIMYHNGKAYVTEYDEFKKMTRAEQDAQIEKGIVVFDVNRGMSETITRNAPTGREALAKLFDSDIPADELERGVKDLLDRYPDARKVDAGADVDRELEQIRKDMHKQFKDFPDFRIIELSDENNEKVLIAIADEDFRNLKRDNVKFGRNARVLGRKSGEIAPSRPRTNAPKPVDAEVKDIDPIGNPFKPKIDKRADVGVKFGDKGIGKYEPIVNPNIKNEADAIKFVKDGGDLSKVPHEYWHAAVKANASRGKVDKDKRFKIVSKNGGAIGDTRIYVFRDADGYGTNQGMVFKAADDDDNVGELIGWNFMHQVGILKGGAVGDGTNEGGKRYVILPFAFNDVPNGNKLTEFGGNPGGGNYPITEINRNISKQYQPQMFAARLNQELLNFALGVADRHRGNGVARAVELPNGDHMAHVIPIDLGWGGRLVQEDPLMGGGVDNRFWQDLNRALGAADASQKERIQKSVIAAWDNMIDSLNRVLEGGEDEFVRDAVKNMDTPAGRRKARKIYDVITQQRARLISNREALLRKIGA